MKPVRLCECGCGRPAPISPYTSRPRGYIKGEPRRFIAGHFGRGAAHHCWQGGRNLDGQGYILVMMPGHARANCNGYVREHVLVAERALGKPLATGAVVHHVNGDRGDNRPANLVVCESRAYHNLLHARQRAVRACGNVDWLPCRFCGQYSDPAEMRLDERSGRAAQHPACAKAYQRVHYQKTRASHSPSQ